MRYLILLLLVGCNTSMTITDEDTKQKDGRYNICQHEENRGTAICP
jgi:hypothetical protein